MGFKLFNMLKQVQAPPKVRKFMGEGTFINSQNINDFTIESKLLLFMSRIFTIISIAYSLKKQLAEFTLNHVAIDVTHSSLKFNPIIINALV